MYRLFYNQEFELMCCQVNSITHQKHSYACVNLFDFISGRFVAKVTMYSTMNIFNCIMTS